MATQDASPSESDKATAGGESAGRKRRGPVKILRTIISFIVILVAVLLVPVSVVGVFATSEVNNTDRYVATVAPLADNEAVQEALTDELTEVILEAINIDQLSQQVAQAVADSPQASGELAKLVGEPLKSGLESFIRQTVTEIIESEVFAEAWTEANRVAHTAIVKLLSGDDTGALTTDGGEIAINLGPIVAQLKTTLEEKGIDAAAQIPETDASFVLYESDDITTVQQAYSIANLLGFWLPIIAIGLAIVGILIANRRRLSTAWFGAGTLVAMIVVMVSLVIVRGIYANALDPSGDQAAAKATYDQITLYLFEGLAAAAVAGGIVAFAAILGGGNSGAQAIREEAKRAARKVGDWIHLPHSEQPQAFARFAQAARIIATIIAVLALFLLDYITPADVLWATAGLLVVVFIIEIFSVDRPAPVKTDEDEVTAEPSLK